MKKYLFALTAILFGMFVLISCDDEEEIKGSTTFYGKVVVNPSAAKLNENVTFSIGEGGFSSDNVSVGISSSTTINGKDVIKSVSYFRASFFRSKPLLTLCLRWPFQSS